MWWRLLHCLQKCQREAEKKQMRALPLPSAIQHKLSSDSDCCRLRCCQWNKPWSTWWELPWHACWAELMSLGTCSLDTERRKMDWNRDKLPGLRSTLMFCCKAFSIAWPNVSDPAHCHSPSKHGLYCTIRSMYKYPLGTDIGTDYPPQALTLSTSKRATSTYSNLYHQTTAQKQPLLTHSVLLSLLPTALAVSASISTPFSERTQAHTAVHHWCNKTWNTYFGVSHCRKHSSE